MKPMVRVALLGLVASTCVSGTWAAEGQESNPTPPANPPAATAPADGQGQAPTPTQPQAGSESSAEAPAPAAAQSAAPAPAPAPAQGQEAAPAQPQAATNPDPAAGTTPTPAGPDGTEVVPLIVIDDVPLTDAIRNLARQSGLNFQFDPRVTSVVVGADGKPQALPNVSFRWENVSAQEALLALLENYNLQLIRDPATRIARVTIKDPKAEEPLSSRIIQLKYADPTNMVAIVKPNLSARSQVIADVRTAQLLISTTTREWDTVSNIVNRLDLPTRQVLIESKMLETAKNPTSIRGIDWAGTFEGQKLSYGNAASGNGGIRSDVVRALSPNTAFLNADGVNAVLSFLNKESDTEVVATPRAVTLDNQQAKLQVTKAFPIIKITPGSANSPAGSEITYTNLGVILEVTPRITANNHISLRVTPEVSNIDSRDSQTLNGATFTANIYSIRRAETHVMIPSGNTLVMGGLINDTASKTYTKVPILGDTPAIGNLFRHKKNVRNKQNLLIFITPTVVDDDAFTANNRGKEFLKSKYTDQTEEPESMWDSAKPMDWTKPSKGTVKSGTQ